MKAVDGKLVDYYDKKAIDRLCAGVFDGVMITKATARSTSSARTISPSP